MTFLSSNVSNTSMKVITLWVFTICVLSFGDHGLLSSEPREMIDAPKTLESYLYEIPARGLVKDLKIEAVRNRSLESSLGLLQSPLNAAPPVFCNPSGSVFAQNANWECGKQKSWQSDHEVLLGEISKVFSKDLLEQCQKAAEETASRELETAIQANYDSSQLIPIAKKYPFTKASMQALILLATLNLERGDPTIAALLMDVAMKRAKQFPSLLSDLLTPRTLFKAALAYAASEQRDGMGWKNEKEKTLALLKASLKGKDLQIGRKNFDYDTLEHEVNRKKDWLKKEDWNLPPFSLIFPQAHRESELAKTIETDRAAKDKKLLKEINTNLELHNLLLLENASKTKAWTDAAIRSVLPSKSSALRNLPTISIFKYLINPEIESCAGSPFNPLIVKNHEELFLIHDVKEKVTSVNCEDHPLSKTQFSNLKNFKNLNSLNLSHNDISDADLQSLKEFRNLKSLNLASTEISDFGLAHLKDLKNLNSLNLSVNRNISDLGLLYLKGLENLVSLDLSATDTSDAAVIKLKNLKNLKSLNLEYNEITDEGLAFFKDLKNLEALNLSFTQVSDKGVAHLKELANLKSLELRNTKLSDKGLTDIKKLKNLTLLNLMGTRISDAGLVDIKDLKKLASLNVGGTEMKISQEGLDNLLKLENLTSLNLLGASVSNVKLVRLKDLKNLEDLNLGLTGISDAEVSQLKELQNLKSLDLSYALISDEGLTQLKELKKLTSLNLSSTLISDRGLIHIKELKNLTSLDLSSGFGHPRISNACLNDLMALKKLKRLNLQKTAVTPDVLLASPLLGQLELLVVTNEPINGYALKEKYPDLKIHWSEK